MQQIKTDYLITKKAALVLRALNHKLRQQILEYLAKHPGTTVTKLYMHFRLEQSVASQHLAVLRKQGLVTCMRDGKQILYGVNHERLQQVEELAEAMLGKPVRVPVFSSVEKTEVLQTAMQKMK